MSQLNNDKAQESAWIKYKNAACISALAVWIAVLLILLFKGIETKENNPNEMVTLALPLWLKAIPFIPIIGMAPIKKMSFSKLFTALSVVVAAVLLFALFAA
ncbi:MAG: hypothetical protein KDC92_15100 [Bacteroidetes bacterium]|nr:hypothetical protein [Bacteroidota bacterium]